MRKVETKSLAPKREARARTKARKDDLALFRGKNLDAIMPEDSSPEFKALIGEIARRLKIELG